MFQRIWSHYTMLLLVWLALITGSLFFVFSGAGVIGAAGLAGFLVTTGWGFSVSSFLRPFPYRTLWGMLASLLCILIFGSLIYWAYASTPLTILITLILTAVLNVALVPARIFSQLPGMRLSLRMKRLRGSVSSLSVVSFLQAAVLGSHIWLLVMLAQHATMGILPSPWLALPTSFFVLYGVATLLLILSILHPKSKKGPRLGLIITHFFVTFHVAAIMYPLGFGYDPLLHRASERAIFENGVIAPKTPFYIGQYVLVNTIAHIAHLPIKLADIALVPLLASVFVPLSAYTGLRGAWRISARWARLGTLLLLLYPLKTMYVTTPHNLATLLLFVTVLLLPAYAKYANARPVLWTIAAASLLTHALSGVFACFALVVFHLYLHRDSFGKKLWRFVLFVLFLGGSILVSSMLILYQSVLGNAPLPVLSSLWERVPHFLSLFREPYYFTRAPVPFIWDMVYTYRVLIVPIIMLGALLGLTYARVRSMGLYILLAALVVMNAFLISTLITFPDLHLYDQLQYAERILHLSVFFLIPISLRGMLFAIQRTRKRLPVSHAPIAFAIAGMLTVSLYLLYPQTNPKSYFRGFNVTAADYEVADHIHATPQETSYIVLSNIITAGAAIERYGFPVYYRTAEGEQFYYSTPSGSPLYKRYLQMVNKTPDRAIVDDALALTGADRAYFVLPSYWDHFEKIKTAASSSADGVREFGGGDVVVFEYYSHR